MTCRSLRRSCRPASVRPRPSWDSLRDRMEHENFIERPAIWCHVEEARSTDLEDDNDAHSRSDISTLAHDSIDETTRRALQL